MHIHSSEYHLKDKSRLLVSIWNKDNKYFITIQDSNSPFEISPINNNKKTFHSLTEADNFIKNIS